LGPSEGGGRPPELTDRVVEEEELALLAEQAASEEVTAFYWVASLADHFGWAPDYWMTMPYVHFQLWHRFAETQQFNRAQRATPRG
jgi:hypothetical protein